MRKKNRRSNDARNFDIAVIGMSCRFPDAFRYRIFWENLVKGKDSIKEVPSNRWSIDQYYSEDINEPGKSISKFGGFIEDVDLFDNKFFAISPREAKAMDPQQRLLLEETWHCIEDSGVSISTLNRHTTSVYVGVMAMDHYSKSQSSTSQTDSFSAAGNYGCILANRLSYYYGLTGISVTIDTACSSSLVAINAACRNLYLDGGGYAIVCGVNLNHSPFKYISFSKARMLSPDGRCKTFDKNANGYVPGEGVGVLLLQPLDEANKANNKIYGIIKGSAVNHVGRSVSMTAPRVESQSALIEAALKNARVDPETITYVEAHGTGTSLGDPIEIEGLTRAYTKYTDKKQYCKIGSVKTNIGHLEASSGVAGIIKVLLMFKHKRIPKTLNIEELNPIIDFSDTPFQVAMELSQWDVPDGQRRRAGISSFGFGGVNAHVILEEYKDDTEEIFNEKIELNTGNKYRLFILSAQTPNSLKHILANWNGFIGKKDYYEMGLDEICQTLDHGRKVFKHRFGVVIENKAQLTQEIIKANHTDYFNSKDLQKHQLCHDKALVLRISNPENIDPTNFSNLNNHDPVYKKYYNECNAVISEITLSNSIIMEENTQVKYRKLYSFSLVYALIKKLLSCDIYPDIVWGEGLGEWIALCVSGVLPLKDCLLGILDNKHIVNTQLVRPAYPLYLHSSSAGAGTGTITFPFHFGKAYKRHLIKDANFSDKDVQRYIHKARQLMTSQHTFNKLMEDWNSAFEEGENDVHQLLNDTWWDQDKEITKANKLLIMIIILSCFRELNKKWNLKERLPELSLGVTELLDLISDKAILHREVIQLIKPGFTSYEKIVKNISNRQNTVDNTKPYTFLRNQSPNLDEIGDKEKWALRIGNTPGTTQKFDHSLILNIAEKNHLSDEIHHVHLILGKHMDQNLSQAVLQLWLKGVDVNVSEFSQYKTLIRSHGLPIYFFDRKTYWSERQEKQIVESHQIPHQYLLNKNWHQQELIVENNLFHKGSYLIISRETANEDFIDSVIKQHSLKVLRVRDGSQASEITSHEFKCNLSDFHSGEELFDLILSKNKDIKGVIDFSDYDKVQSGHELPDYGKIRLFQKLINFNKKEGLAILHFTRYLQSFQNSSPQLKGAITAGLVKTFNHEYKQIKAKTIDLDCDLNHSTFLFQLIQNELVNWDFHSEICYRGNLRYVPCFEKISGEEVQESILNQPSISSEKVYVIAGGTRGIGCEIAKYLVARGGRKLVLMGRNPLPERELWDGILSEMDQNKQSEIQKIHNIMALEKGGAQVEIYTKSISNQRDLSEYFSYIRNQVGSIGGVCNCAGLIIDKNPAFIHKSLQDMESVFEPKILGTQVLADVFAEDPLDFFILFSSISAAIPSLATGLIDYSCANSFLDHFAHTQYFEKPWIKSINWPSWNEAGMGEIKSRKQDVLGLKSITNSEGIALFEHILNTDGHPSLFPCIVYEDQFNSEKLLIPFQKTEHEIRVVPDIISENETTKKGTQTKQLDAIFAQVLEMEPSEISEEVSFEDLGIDSILIAELVSRIEEFTGHVLDPTVFMEHNTLGSLEKYIEKQSYNANNDLRETSKNKPVPIPPPLNRQEKIPHRSVNISSSKIAIIGMACRFPGARNKDIFWQNLVDGRDSVSEIPADRWDKNKLYSPRPEHGKSISKWGGFIEGGDLFDPGYFQIKEEDAPHMDPLVRLSLETINDAMRDAGYEKKELWKKPVGLFIGSRVSTYLNKIKNYRKNTITGIGQNFIAAFASHFFNFTGPSAVIDSACSSSLFTTHLACQSLLTGDSEYAFTGGVDFLLDESLYLMLSEGKALSPDGKCFTFDKRANGFVPGEGCGIVLLKTLDKAVKDKDRIYGIIESSAVNNDGHTMGVTTPNLEAQRDVIQLALKKMNIHPSTISNVEAHGTGTMIGDPIELKALTQVFRQYTDRTGYCSLGSVKTNIGHLLSASGSASLIKIALSLHHKQLPPTLNCSDPNPRFDFKSSPFFPNSSLRDWTPIDGFRRSAISSFGFGGTNCHAILCDLESENIINYEARRRALPPASYNKKRYWPDEQKKTPGSESEEKDEERYPQSLRKIEEEAAAMFQITKIT